MTEILLSIRHEWAEKIYRREKTAELRKTTPRSHDFWRDLHLVRLYEPELGRVTGTFSLVTVIETESVDTVLSLNPALTAAEIEAYGPGRDGKFHVWLTGWAMKLAEPMELRDFGLTRPPQSWRYLVNPNDQPVL